MPTKKKFKKKSKFLKNPNHILLSFSLPWQPLQERFLHLLPQFCNLTAGTAQALVVLNLHGVTPRRLLKIRITQSSAEHNSFPELWPFPKIWAGTTLPTGAKGMANPCLSKQPQKRAAARSDCKAGTISLNSECKHRFIIRLFFWVTQPMP